MPKLRRQSGGRVAFWCPGCDESHDVTVGAGGIWQWNGNTDAPTFSPSVKLTSGHFIPGHKAGDPCWCTYNADHPDDPSRFRCRVCHSFVREGRIQFLSDCTHALAGHTVDLPEWPVEVRG